MLISVQLSSFLHLMHSLPRLFDWSDCEYVDRALDMFVHGTDVEQKDSMMAALHWRACGHVRGTGLAGLAFFGGNCYIARSQSRIFEL
jgi:hypothetical protein